MLKVLVQGQEKVLEAENEGLEIEINGYDEELYENDEEEEDEEEGEENESEDEEEGEDSEGEGESNNGIEDGFFKIKDLKKSLEDSAREYGLMKTDKKKKKKKKKKGSWVGVGDGGLVGKAGWVSAMVAERGRERVMDFYVFRVQF